MAKEEKIIIGISGSPREGNTSYMLRTVLEATDLEYELILLKDKKINPCGACGGCFYSHKCVVNDDMQQLYDKLSKADIVVFGSPTYFGNVTGLLKNFIDRCLPLYLAEKMRGKKAVVLSSGNFKKGEVRFLNGFDIENAMNDSKQREELVKPIKKCISIMESFCKEHMMMNVIGKILIINGDPKSKEQDLIKLGRRLVS